MLVHFNIEYLQLVPLCVAVQLDLLHHIRLLAVCLNLDRVCALLGVVSRSVGEYVWVQVLHLRISLRQIFPVAEVVAEVLLRDVKVLVKQGRVAAHI